jgi:tetratricopeptide (TPR) repeat protein
MDESSQYSMDRDLIKHWLWIIPLIAAVILVSVQIVTAVRNNLSYIAILRSLDCYPYLPHFMDTACTVSFDGQMMSQSSGGIDLLESPTDKANESAIQLSGNQENVKFTNKFSNPITLPPSRDLSVLALGNTFYNNDLKSEAYAIWKEVDKISEYFYNLSKLSSDPEVEIELLSLSLKIKRTGKGYYFLAQRLAGTGRQNQAVNVYEKGIKYAERENNFEILSKIFTRLGDLSLRLKQPQEALEYYQEVLQLNGSLSPNATINLAKAMIHLEMYENAREYLISLTQTNSDLAKAWWWLGEVERLRGDRDAAITAYLEYGHLEPTDELLMDRLIDLDYFK